MNVLERADRKRNIEGNPAGAVAILEKALQDAKDEDRIPILLKLANYQIDVGQVEEAQNSFKQVIDLARAGKEYLALADAQRKWAYLLWHQHANKEEALSLARSALRALKKDSKSSRRENLKVAANIFATFGNIYGDSKEFRKASIWYRKALGSAEDAGFKERTVTVLGDLGNLFLWRKDYSEAREYLQQAARRAKRYYRHAYPSSLLRLGRLYLQQEDLLRAEKFARESLEASLKGEWEREKADAWDLLGDIASVRGGKREAERFYRRALESYLKIKHIPSAERVRSKIKALVK
ncbi:tetratricopeptide repeat protein [Candidatus Saccharibacteria bacterium]|nr:tetratricopeptide repeat protein [Candidatus Saccharibacteria bacterium]